MNIEQTLAMPASAAHLRARLVYAYEVGPLSGHSFAAMWCWWSATVGTKKRCGSRSWQWRRVGLGVEIASSGGIVDVDLPMTLKAQEICKRGDRFVLAGVA